MGSHLRGEPPTSGDVPKYQFFRPVTESLALFYTNFQYFAKNTLIFIQFKFDIFQNNTKIKCFVWRRKIMEEVKNTQIKIFEERQVRTIWDKEKEEWYFSVVDVIAVLTDSQIREIIGKF